LLTNSQPNAEDKTQATVSAESRPPEGTQPPQTNRNGRSPTTPEKQMKETVFPFAKAASKAKLLSNKRLRRFPLALLAESGGA